MADYDRFLAKSLYTPHNTGVERVTEIGTFRIADASAEGNARVWMQEDSEQSFRSLVFSEERGRWVFLNADGEITLLLCNYERADPWEQREPSVCESVRASRDVRYERFTNRTDGQSEEIRRIDTSDGNASVLYGYTSWSNRETANLSAGRKFWRTYDVLFVNLSPSIRFPDVSNPSYKSYSSGFHVTRDSFGKEGHAFDVRSANPRFAFRREFSLSWDYIAEDEMRVLRNFFAASHGMAFAYRPPMEESDVVCIFKPGVDFSAAKKQGGMYSVRMSLEEFVE